MATVLFKGTSANTSGELPKLGSKAPLFSLTRTNLTQANLESFRGKNLILNIFPSVDTGTCAQSVRTFNREATELENTSVLCISKDLPFAQNRFCGAEGIENVIMLSDYKNNSFGEDYGVRFNDGPFEGLLARAVVVIDKEGKTIHTELVSNIGDEPNYKAALEAYTMAEESIIKNRLKGFVYALKGAFLLLRTESSIQVQFIMALVMTAAGFYFDISAVEWMLQTLAIGLVMGVEGVNTAVEKLSDYIQPNHDPKIGFVKDISAGAVMFVAIASVVVGLIIYLPKIF